MRLRRNVWNKILRRIDENYGDETINLCKKLIRIKSLSGKEDEIALLISKSMRELGYDRVEVDEVGNIVGIIEGEVNSSPLLLFDGHMDTVGEGLSSNWRHHPYSAISVDDVIHGRGASDMKGGLAAMIMACSLIKECLGNLDNSVIMACVVHEEDCEGFGVKKILEKYGKPKYIVLGEATNLSLAIGHRGRVELEIETMGRTAHGSVPDRGVNAIYKMMPVIRRIKSVKETSCHPFLGCSSASVNRIWCSPSETSIIPDSCTIVVDRRTVLGETKQSILSEGLSYLRNIKGDVRIATRKITCYTGYSEMVEQYFPAWITPPRHKLVKVAREYLEFALKREVTLSKWSFSTDGAYTAGVEKIPTIGFGPGEEKFAHTPNDQIRKSDILESLKGYVALALGLIGYEVN